MKKLWSGGIIGLSLISFMVLSYVLYMYPLEKRVLQAGLYYYNSSSHSFWRNDEIQIAVPLPENVTEVFSANVLLASSATFGNLSTEELRSMQTWNHMPHLLNHTKGLPQAAEAIKEGLTAWETLMNSVQEEKILLSVNGSALLGVREKQCPYSIRRMNSSDFSGSGFKLKIPCGLGQGSSITVIGIPGGLLGDFRIDLTGTTLPGEPDPPIILHYNVRPHGDKVTEDPVIVQNTWTLAQDWGTEKRCPLPDSSNRRKVDELEECSEVVGKYDKQTIISRTNTSNNLRKFGDAQEKRYFPFKEGYLFIATLRVGVEGIQMTVDGKHVTSFEYRESLEPWLVSEVRISGDIKLISVLASGLPTSEDLSHVVDLDSLKSPPIPLHKPLDLFIGVFSTANNFKHRMSVRRTWLQYPAVRSGEVAVRFFVGLHKNQMVNEELWKEAKTYGDIQLMPYVDYYSLITWKTIAICIYGVDVVSAKYIMKTDDDAFVRVDEVLSSLKDSNTTHGLLYGRINSNAQPHRSTESKWYISYEEWPDETYPPWAHGPGYVVSHDIAKAVYRQHQKGRLRLFKLEDVAMGIWISEMKKKGMNVKYVKEERIYIDGCEAGYLVAHYQGPRDMLCLWQKLEETHRATCCGGK